MSLSAPAATSENKLPEVATDEELKSFFSSGSKRFQSSEEDTEEMSLDALKAVFSVPSLQATTKVKVNATTFGTSCGDPSLFPPNISDRIKQMEAAQLEPPSQLQVEEAKEEEQRADELRHNVAVRKANLAWQRAAHPLVIRATCAKFLRLAAVLKKKIIETTSAEEKVPGVADLLKYNSAFIKGVEETLDETLRKLTEFMEEKDPKKLPSQADLAAQTQQVLGTLAETFLVDDLNR